MASAKGEQPKSARYSVTLVPPAVQAVDELVEATGLNKADVINRAVQIYAFLEERRREGKIVLLRGPDEKEERVHIV
ncbi:hypothetical protein AB0M94_28700 [Streptomyces xanthochromogenes]|uniref:hypothetical protein n=1 Tax=Streptomyces xanthochromogenes TaxID=67384 RepID=UPI003417814F